MFLFRNPKFCPTLQKAGVKNLCYLPVQNDQIIYEYRSNLFIAFIK